MNQGITIRLGASHNSLTVASNGLAFDMSAMDKTERYELRRALIEGLKTTGYFGKKEQRRAVFRARQKGRA
ncbi:hypothetical protein CN233_04550 [Sinorhizobium meliloti]|uniref:hypothetical protein n=1 Tax=Sinorhizobium TaxID=28105 RepID=UPI0003DCE485|nr:MULTISPECIES: hypothetical protein [Sinorhizobium]ARS72251.1 hypothetical protein SMRU11_36050 [Sinorhizobium meliloti RU11/001]MDX0762356.1 hypothetical protein [Sinorhizobium medicae]MDX0823525.1 hypothetical protein [Sinorhizobium medicae]RVG38007.1 hypothetical protein CN233_04550 [Sinorhizobium meliloti]RVI11995.1 hypothetical protein CN206_12670 [Sinorhizobium meliloti]